MTIMIADDSFSMRIAMKDMLLTAGYGNTIEASNGQEAIKKLTELDGKVDLILLDISMPKLDGISVLKILKKTPKTQNIPVIMVTSNTDKNIVVECISLGVAGYVSKPFTSKAFILAVEKALKSEK
jgi:two-component system chemotaxis response regulator CheY